VAECMDGYVQMPSFHDGGQVPRLYRQHWYRENWLIGDLGAIAGAGA